jgi:hypothetical protein
VKSSRTTNGRDLRGRKRCRTGWSVTPHDVDLNTVTPEHSVGNKSRQENWEQTSVSTWKDRLDYTDVVVHSDRIDNFERIILERGFVTGFSVDGGTVRRIFD